MRGYEVTDGTVTLILYGARYIDDLETVAVIDIENDGVELVPYEPEYDYKIVRGISVKEAFKEARRFVGFHHDFWIVNTRRIVDKAGRTIGYEFIPSYESVNISPVIGYWTGDAGIVYFNVTFGPFFKELFFDERDDKR